MTTAWLSRCALFAGVAATLLLTPADGLAQSSAVDQARQHADAGQAALQAGEFQRAYDEYQAAYDLFPNSLLLVNVARALSGLGRNRDAIGKLQTVLGDAALDAARRQEVETEIGRLRGLVVELSVSVSPAGSRVSVNGDDVGDTPLAGPVLVDPGQITVEATHDGFRAGRWAGTLAAGAHRPVSIALEAIEAADDGAGQGGGGGEQIVTPPPPPPPAGHGSNTLMWVTGVGAGVLGAASLTLGAIVSGKHSDYSDNTAACSGDTRDECVAQYKDDRSSGRTLALVADVLGGVAIVGGAIFVYLLVTSGDAEQAAATALAEPGVLHF